jgi:Cu+-exporting ATPase
MTTIRDHPPATAGHREHRCCSHAAPEGHPKSELAAGQARQAIDPVCGMDVDPHATPHRYELSGQTYYFCSAGCRSKFAADSDRYLGEKVPAPVLSGLVPFSGYDTRC